MRLDKKALFGLGVIAVAVLAFKPGWFTVALPILLLSLCPLSMVFMMRGMHSGQSNGRTGSACGTGGDAASSVNETELSEQISALQIELRDLKAAQAWRYSGAAAEAGAAVDFTKEPSSDARA